MPEPVIAALLFVAGLLASVLNAVAGNGGFVTFPVLPSTGIPPLMANGTNAVAVWPGHALRSTRTGTNCGIVRVVSPGQSSRHFPAGRPARSCWVMSATNASMP